LHGVGSETFVSITAYLIEYTQIALNLIIHQLWDQLASALSATPPPEPLLNKPNPQALPQLLSSPPLLITQITMSDITDFITALEAAQSKAKFTSEVQEAATGIDAATLKAAVEAALAMGESEKLSDDAQIAALKKGLDFAAKLVMMLKTAPGPFEKKDLWVYFKIGNNVVPEKPGMFDMVVC
jgi:Tfp pilus assembly protein PilV